MAFPTDWSHKLAITIDHTKIDSDLSNWTLVFDQAFDSVLTSVNGPLDADGTRSMIDGGGDIRFSSDADGLNQLAIDVRAAVIDNDPASGELELAINVPSVSSSIDTTIYMWWGKSGETQPDVSDTYGQYNAYDSTHKIVISFRDWNDRTSNGHDFDINDTGDATNNNAGGAIGRYGEFDGNDIRRTTTTIVQSGNFAMEAVAKRNSSTGNSEQAIAGHSSTGTKQLSINFTVSSAYWGGYLGSNRAGKVSGSYSNWPDSVNWHHAVFLRSGFPSHTLYFDGGSPSVHSIYNSTSNNVQFLGSSYSNTSECINGQISEYRFHSDTRSTAWIKANYNNFMNVSGFLTWGSIDDGGSGDITGTVGIVFDNGGDLKGDGSLIGTTNGLIFVGSGDLKGDGLLAVNTGIVFDVSGNVSDTGGVAGSTSLAFIITGSLTSTTDAIARLVIDPAPLKEGLLGGLNNIIKSQPWVQWFSKLTAKPALDVPNDKTKFLRGDDTWDYSQLRFYSQDAEPTLSSDNESAFWKDTDDSNKVYLVFKRGDGDQVKVLLS